MESKLLWFPKFGIGYYPVEDQPYDEAYWQKYLVMENTEIGKTLNNARVELVQAYKMDEILDIGIGSGAFVKALDYAYGFDINPCAIAWLKEAGKYKDPYPLDSMSFWDSLEHIHNPSYLLSYIKKYAFISCPVYEDKEHILRSKHFRPDEHCWYWTKKGLERFMSNFGFSLLEYNLMETEIGREDIGTFVFVREI